MFSCTQTLKTNLYMYYFAIALSLAYLTHQAASRRGWNGSSQKDVPLVAGLLSLCLSFHFLPLYWSIEAYRSLAKVRICLVLFLTILSIRILCGENTLYWYLSDLTTADVSLKCSLNVFGNLHILTVLLSISFWTKSYVWMLLS